MDNPHKNPAPGWLSDKQWGEVCRLGELPALSGFREDFESATKEWQAIYDSTEPHTMALPGRWEKTVTPLERLCALRTIRPDKVVLAIQNFVIGEMTEKFVKPPVFDLALSFNESSCTVPLVFILSKGSDPMGALLKVGRPIIPFTLPCGAPCPAVLPLLLTDSLSLRPLSLCPSSLSSVSVAPSLFVSSFLARGRAEHRGSSGEPGSGAGAHRRVAHRASEDCHRSGSRCSDPVDSFHVAGRVGSSRAASGAAVSARRGRLRRRWNCR